MGRSRAAPNVINWSSDVLRRPRSGAYLPTHQFVMHWTAQRNVIATKVANNLPPRTVKRSTVGVLQRPVGDFGLPTRRGPINYSLRCQSSHGIAFLRYVAFIG